MRSAVNMCPVGYMFMSCSTTWHQHLVGQSTPMVTMGFLTPDWLMKYLTCDPEVGNFKALVIHMAFYDLSICSHTARSVLIYKTNTHYVAISSTNQIIHCSSGYCDR